MPTCLNENEKLSCDKQISLEELNCAVNNLKINKSPGLDGLTPEFYKDFWDILKIPFHKMVNETYDKGFLPETYFAYFIKRMTVLYLKIIAL